MSVGAWMIGLVLLGQVGAGSGRYQAAGTNPFAPGGASSTPTNGATGNGSGTLPMVDSSVQGVSAPQGTSSPISPNSRATSPYGPTSASPIGSSGTYPPPGVGTSSTLPTGNSPWQTTPSSASPATSTTNSADDLKPAGKMRAMLTAPRDSRLPGNLISLADAVAGASSRADQAARIEAYWDLCSSVADYYLSLREQDELQRLRSRIPRAGQNWQQAESELAVRVGTSLAAATASQYRLASLMGIGGSLPLPADIPHCGDYHTRYNEIFAGRASAEAAELAKLLPQRCAELKDASQAVTRAQDWLESTVTRSDNADGVETLRALELLALRRRAFVQIARDYNRRISRYTELSTPGQVAPDRLIGMLIKSPASATATRTSAPVPFNRQSQNAPSLPKTFEEGWAPASGEKVGNEKVGDAVLDEAIKQASGETEAATDQLPREERSLLVNPQ